MKIYLTVTLFLFSGIVWAQSLKGGIAGNFQTDYFEQLNLTPMQKNYVLKIMNEENFVLRPLSLDIEAKERGLEELYNLKCDIFDRACKTRLKQEIEQAESEKTETMRKIQQKKNYYAIRYKNVLTREQNIKLEELLEQEKHQEKVLAERAEKQRKQDTLNKLKIWNKFKK